ncbi:MAG: metal ABC transporter permease [Desulfobacterales bacterium]|nr:metal ABC transporter permease [Desulfobacterales bacterium]
MLDIFQYEFMRNALFAGLLAGIACGIIGSLVVSNRIVFIAGGIAHSAYGGIGIAYYFGFPYILGTLGFSIVYAFFMAAISIKEKYRSDTIIGVLWAIGMAIGIILTDLKPGYNVDLISYLFGSMITVPRTDIYIMIILTIFIALTVWYFYNNFLAMSYDIEFAQVRGVPIRFLYFLLLMMIAISVVIIIRVVGLILVIALLTIPPYISEKYCVSLYKMMFFSIVLNWIFIIVGLIFSFFLNLTSGATIIMIASIAFFISLALDRFKNRKIFEIPE